jgi:hypothetical protein
MMQYGEVAATEYSSYSEDQGLNLGPKNDYYAASSVLQDKCFGTTTK